MYIKQSPEAVSAKEYKRDDCTVNALGNALGISYDLAKKTLQTALPYPSGLQFLKSGPRTKKEFTRKTYVQSLCHKLSVREINYLEQRKSVNFERFSRENPNGLFFILSNNHIAVAKNGQLIDAWDSRKKKIEIAYELNIEDSRKQISELAKFYKMNTEEHIKPLNSKGEVKKKGKVFGTKKKVSTQKKVIKNKRSEYNEN